MSPPTEELLARPQPSPAADPSPSGRRRIAPDLAYIVAFVAGLAYLLLRWPGR